ncbi:mitochondrial mRNA pseudouridine synthase RPUSD3 isoform X3 [Podarcis raffonei]|uniref:mitochondrial mRNA pseudouridine synthase RPUSD3 isoform X3 n=1 Tax=Podarcis raffonei TaxID=65483 RepID=UPI00232981DA|nr:mitochondrial mRNA pseudouridine synthase RPUSD3 isoform X3 [Podarcis raffonei]
MEPSALLGVAMFRSSPWCLLCGCGRPFSSRAWYQLLQKQRGSRKPVTDNSSEVSILSPTRSLSPEEMLNLLEASVVHADGSLVAISKPPGLPVTGKPEELTLLSLLPDLSQKLGFPQNLDVIKAAVKESSGLVLLSGCPSTTQRLQDFYARCKRAGDPAATYCAVTTRIPAASEGEIRTCLKLIKVEDHKLVVPVASPSRGSLQRKEVRKTQTLYKVLDSREGCALVQLQPLTGPRRCSAEEAVPAAATGAPIASPPAPAPAPPPGRRLPFLPHCAHGSSATFFPEDPLSSGPRLAAGQKQAVTRHPKRLPQLSRYRLPRSSGSDGF